MGCQIEFWKGREKTTNKYWRAKKRGIIFQFFCEHNKFFLLTLFFSSLFRQLFEHITFMFWKILDQIFFTHLTFKSTASFFIIKVRIWKDIWRGRGKEREIFFALNFQILKFWRTRSIHTSILKLASLFLHYFYMYLSSIKHLFWKAQWYCDKHTLFSFLNIEFFSFHYLQSRFWLGGDFFCQNWLKVLSNKLAIPINMIDMNDIDLHNIGKILYFKRHLTIFFCMFIR